MLQNKWSSVYDINSLILSIIVLLKEPNPDSPANPLAAKLFVEDRAEFYRKVQESSITSWNTSFDSIKK